jgi:hypothetical protein
MKMFRVSWLISIIQSSDERGIESFEVCVKENRKLGEANGEAFGGLKGGDESGIEIYLPSVQRQGLIYLLFLQYRAEVHCCRQC